MSILFYNRSIAEERLVLATIESFNTKPASLILSRILLIVDSGATVDLFLTRNTNSSPLITICLTRLTNSREVEPTENIFVIYFFIFIFDDIFDDMMT